MTQKKKKKKNARMTMGVPKKRGGPNTGAWEANLRGLPRTQSVKGSRATQGLLLRAGPKKKKSGAPSGGKNTHQESSTTRGVKGEKDVSE